MSSGKYEDLTGHTFGELTVLSRDTENNSLDNKHDVKWLCKCSCGNLTRVSTYNLNSGKTKSCGCLRKKKRQYTDLTGETFNYYTVLYEDLQKEKEKDNKIRYWVCKCICGKINTVSETCLKTGRSKSCGCKTGYLISNKKAEKRKELNQYKKVDDHVVIITQDNYEIIIDEDDTNKCQEYCWYVEKYSSYAASSTKKNKVYMHRLILGITDSNTFVDHKNGNRLDNRKSNLRVCSASENTMNSKSRLNKYPYPGVTWCKRRNKWLVQIQSHNQQHNIGGFENYEEAIQARIAAEEKYHGEFGYYNSRIKPKDDKEENNNGEIWTQEHDI